jgi:hypothetical protein
VSTAELLDECFTLWPAWCTLVGHVSRAHPREADPHSIYGSACGADRDRLVALLYAHQIAPTMIEAREVLTVVLKMAQAGRRPRYGAELLGGPA